MERLTDKNADGNYFYPKCFEKCYGLGASRKCDNCEITTSICEKLGKYEDLDEQGRRDSRQTNADRIRNMSDEELAELITGSLNFDCADYCDSFAQGCAFNCNKKDREIALKWLQSEAE